MHDSELPEGNNIIASSEAFRTQKSPRWCDVERTHFFDQLDQPRWPIASYEVGIGLLSMVTCYKLGLLSALQGGAEWPSRFTDASLAPLSTAMTFDWQERAEHQKLLLAVVLGLGSNALGQNPKSTFFWLTPASLQKTFQSRSNPMQ